MRMFLLPYNSKSTGARALAHHPELDIKMIKRVGSRYIPRYGDIIINWGCGPNNFPFARLGGAALVLNSPTSVGEVVNKLKFYQMNAMYVPDFSTDIEWAKSIIRDDGYIFCRKILSGSGGKGIVVARVIDDLVDAPVYCKHIKKDSEWRIHLFMSPEGEVEVVDLQKKVKRKDGPRDNWMVRNWDNGFIYIRGFKEIPECVLDTAKNCFSTSGLEFGAVDMIYNKASDTAYVLEINSAPGMEGTTVEKYAKKFKEYCF